MCGCGVGRASNLCSDTFLSVASWDDLLRDERGAPYAQVFALDCVFVDRTCMVGRLGVCVLASAFGPSNTFPELCVPDGPFQGDFRARFGPFGTMGNVRMGTDLVADTVAHGPTEQEKLVLFP